MDVSDSSGARKRYFASGESTDRTARTLRPADKEHVEACGRATGSVLPGAHTCTRRVGSDVKNFAKKQPQHVGADTRDGVW